MDVDALVRCGRESYLDAVVVDSAFSVRGTSPPFWRRQSHLLLAGVRQLVLAGGSAVPTMRQVVSLVQDEPRFADVVLLGVERLQAAASPVSLAFCGGLRLWSVEWLRTDPKVRRLVLDGLAVVGPGVRLRWRAAVDAGGVVALADRSAPWADYETDLLPQHARDALDRGLLCVAAHEVRSVDEVATADALAASTSLASESSASPVPVSGV